MGFGRDINIGFPHDITRTTAIRFHWANATVRAAQTGMVVGDIGHQEDTNILYIYTSAGAWGLFLTGG